MPYTINFLEDSAICFTKIYGETVFEEHIQLWQQMDDHLTRHDIQMTYWLIDATHIWMSHQNWVRVMEYNFRGIAGTISDSRVIPILVSSRPTRCFLRDLVVDREGDYKGYLDIPFFTDLEKAYAFLKLIQMTNPG